MQTKYKISKKEKWMRFWVVIAIALWITGLILPFHFFAPATFWEKAVFAVGELFWAGFSAVMYFFVLVFINETMD